MIKYMYFLFVEKQFFHEKLIVVPENIQSQDFKTKSYFHLGTRSSQFKIPTVPWWTLYVPTYLLFQPLSNKKEKEVKIDERSQNGDGFTCAKCDKWFKSERHYSKHVQTCSVSKSVENGEFKNKNHVCNFKNEGKIFLQKLIKLIFSAAKQQILWVVSLWGLCITFV